jgi:CheY-like chemotaxis protein
LPVITRRLELTDISKEPKNGLARYEFLLTFKRILMTDDFKLVHTAIATLLGNSFEVVGTVSDEQAAMDAVSELKPELVILDISMPDKTD